jgi:nucleoside-diphosphate-sugar epimerase
MKKEVILLTGSAGFIGSNLTKYFLKKKKILLGIDNLKLGKLENIKAFIYNKNFFFKKLDISNFSKLDGFIKKFTQHYIIRDIWHLAANSDIKNGSKDLDNDYKNTFLTKIIKLMLFL